MGTNGVGNIFFGNCNLKCVYCQNHDISQNWREEKNNTISFERLAEMMIELQDLGAHSIGFVSPSHFVPQIIKALKIAIGNGLHLPLIYNTNSYDSVEVLKLLDGIIDIYLPDIKYADDATAYKYSKIKNYVSISREALLEIFHQVGDSLIHDEFGIVQRGLIIRHLVLPNDLARSEDSLSWISKNLSRDVALSVMAQYYPANKALTLELLDRRIRESEYNRVVRIVDALGFTNGWIQDFESHEYYRPDFSDRAHPFQGGASNGSDDTNSSEGRTKEDERLELSRWERNPEGIHP